MAELRYITVDGSVPFDGMPPDFLARSGQQHGIPQRYILVPAQPPQVTPVLPQPDLGAIPGWQPWQAPPGIVPPPYHAASPLPPPSEAPDPTPAPTPAPSTGPPLPPGAYIPTTTDTPLVLPSGQGYIFPSSHTTIHVFESNFPPWDHPGRSINFRSFCTSPTLTIKELIEQLCPQKGPDGKKVKSRGITECLESGDGVWLKGSEFWVGEKGNSDSMKAKVDRALAKIGWDASRGTTARPIWLAVSIVVE
ncbi:hypothetical protein LOZ39_000437 [Ophidiomyces ophidiicola]|uniref:Uncharacterized protein n=1 Tax=Ophidiomyces ophidiicola TaxID=1387563 RepID=A0ACB8UW88_9EURO|nr:hypothetical protein LOZ61_000508 [Ophidiomyces ophidiicola]KAI1924328.1 hypothetical protein LOZ64_000653 [Ophidiomyces ophidiicola]KAI1929229.1 hypothetical protein LOZ60_001698 [Ophidiomyces ophidiicola]KAI1957712.1 hypothetical protein LOZ59_003814 [Ophidiomyces ophidiicola]KAI1974895.1 hypothetical protein LOZ56_000923 [Ophidiomyces ophidiicola]